MSISRTILGAIISITVLQTLAAARQDTVYMSVLNSRKHRLGALDNPTVGLFFSTDAGATWHHRGWTGYIRTFYTEAGSDGVLWSACGNGVLRSGDGGKSWRITTGWEITEVLKVRVNPVNAKDVYAATAYGVFRTSDSGENWEELNDGFRKPFVDDLMIDRRNPERLLAATEDGLYESTDSGRKWRLSGLRGQGVRTIVQHPVNSSKILAGTEDAGVFVSDDGGKSWRASNAGLGLVTVYSIACDPSGASTIYLGTHGKGVFRSTDGGMSWRNASDGLTNPVVHAIVVLPSRPSTVFAGTLNGGLFRSTDAGAHWTFDSQEEAQVWGLWTR
jgi:photosystem II stability/assembly factor-like uncharacterized protein